MEGPNENGLAAGVDAAGATVGAGVAAEEVADPPRLSPPKSGF